MRLEIFQHLLPKSRAWDLTIGKKNIRKFFSGLVPFNQAIQLFYDQIFEDIDPDKTRELDAWEKQWGLEASTQSDADRRARLRGAWAGSGGQSPAYIQATLQAAGFSLFVHDHWDASFPPKVVRDPNAILAASSTFYFGECGQTGAECGQIEMECGNTQAGAPSTGYALVNNIPGISYTIPADTSKWPYFLYVGAATFPAKASVPLSRKAEMETLLLKICPAQNWIGVLVTFT